MLKNIVLLPLLFTLLLPAAAQKSNPSGNPRITQLIHYKDLVFQSVTVEKNLSYSSVRKGRSTSFDLYQPAEDSTSLRPLILWMHGGGFKFGSKDATEIRLWSNSFARRGYVCAAINYPLGSKNLSFSFSGLVKNCYRAVQDVRQAITFFENNAARFRIDTNRIILAGNSAGGMIALQAAYSNNAQLIGLLGGDAPFPGKDIAQSAGPIAAVINFWGGIFNTEWLRSARIPIVSVHGDRDKIVPYDHKGYPLYGSLPIHQKADSLHIPNRLKTYEGYSHELQRHFNPIIVSRATRRRWLEAGQFAADFLYEELFRDAR